MGLVEPITRVAVDSVPVHRDIVVIGTSAGGVEALTRLVGGLPGSFEASIFVVLHTPHTHVSALPTILSRSGTLRATHPQDGDSIEPGHIYIAPPDKHLLIEPGRMRLTRGPKENGFRPAIDTLFRSAAETYGSRTVGVVLTGSRSDGSVGLQLVKRAGGLAIVQDPEDSLFPGMPLNAIERVEVDHVLPIADVADVLVRSTSRVRGNGKEERVGGSDVGDETPSPQVAGSLGGESEPDRSPSPYTCPECSGSLWDHTEGDITRYTCRVGHSFTSEALVLLQQDAIEAILWSAVRALEEKHSLCERIAKGLREGGQHSAAEPFQRRAGDALEQAAPLRAILLREEAEPEASEAPVG